jgi:hypothetical protein
MELLNPYKARWSNRSSSTVCAYAHLMLFVFGVMFTNCDSDAGEKDKEVEDHSAKY